MSLIHGKFIGLACMLLFGLLTHAMHAAPSSESGNQADGSGDFQVIAFDQKLQLNSGGNLAFALGADGSLFIGCAHDTDDDHIAAEWIVEVFKVNPDGEIAWRKTISAAGTPKLAARPDGGVIAAISLQSKEKSSRILFLDQNGTVQAEWNQPSKPLVAMQIFSLQSAFNGDALFLFFPHSQQKNHSMNDPWIACVSASGQEKWLTHVRDGLRPFFLSVSPRGFVSWLGIDIGSGAQSSLFTGGRVNSSEPPSVMDWQEPYKDRPVAMVSSLEENGVIYVVFEEETVNEMVYRIDRIYFLDKRGLQKKTIARLPSWKAELFEKHVTKNQDAAHAWKRRLSVNIVSLPNGQVALLDGWCSARLTIFDVAGKILHRHEYTGKGSAWGDALFYDTKAKTLHILGRMGEQGQMPWEVHEPFWVKYVL